MALSEQAALNKDRRNHTSEMQHRHFATIADIIAESPFGAKMQRQVAEYFADRLRATNPRFDRARFLRACNLVEEE